MTEDENFPKADVSTILSKMEDLIEFAGIKLYSVNDRSILGNTPLHISAVSGDVTTGRTLLEAGANSNVNGEYGNTPLHEALGQGHYDFVKLLLGFGASTSVKNDDGITPEDVARESDDLRIRSLLSI